MPKQEPLKYDPYFSSKKMNENNVIRKHIPVKNRYTVKNHLSSNQPEYSVDLFTASPPVKPKEKGVESVSLQIDWEVVKAQNNYSRMSRFQRLYLRLKDMVKSKLQILFRKSKK